MKNGFGHEIEIQGGIIVSSTPFGLGLLVANEFTDKDGLTWVQLSPFGRFPNVQGLQVFAAQDGTAIANEFNGILSTPQRVIGLPWYIGHPDHPMHRERYKDTRAYGRIKSLECRESANCQTCSDFQSNRDGVEPCREHGLFAGVRFNDDGKKLIANEMFQGHSVNWRLRKVGNEFHPFSLKSVGFTNEPNIPVPSILAANEAAAALEEEFQFGERLAAMANIRLWSEKGCEWFANAGTSEGVRKAWLTRSHGGHSPDDNYEKSEHSRHFAKMREDESQPLNHRKSAEDEAHSHMANDPEGYANRADWVLRGHYGRGAQKHAELMMSSRGNRAAMLTQMVAQYEHNSPQSHTNKAFNRLSPEQKAKLNEHMQRVLSNHDKEAGYDESVSKPKARSNAMASMRKK